MSFDGRIIVLAVGHAPDLGRGRVGMADDVEREREANRGHRGLGTIRLERNGEWVGRKGNPIADGANLAAVWQHRLNVGLQALLAEGRNCEKAQESREDPTENHAY